MHLRRIPPQQHPAARPVRRSRRRFRRQLQPTRLRQRKATAVAHHRRDAARRTAASRLLRRPQPITQRQVRQPQPIRPGKTVPKPHRPIRTSVGSAGSRRSHHPDHGPAVLPNPTLAHASTGPPTQHRDRGQTPIPIQCRTFCRGVARGSRGVGPFFQASLRARIGSLCRRVLPAEIVDRPAELIDWLRGAGGAHGRIMLGIRMDVKGRLKARVQ